jgi:hypothetical protein
MSYMAKKALKKRKAETQPQLTHRHGLVQMIREGDQERDALEFFINIQLSLSLLVICPVVHSEYLKRIPCLGVSVRTFWRRFFLA